MKNFQAKLDAAFGPPRLDRAPQLPSDASKERDRAFAERAKRIEELRQVRLSKPEEQRVRLVFEVVRHRGHWRTLHRAKHSSPFPDQAAAILAAKKLARQKRDLGHPVEVILRRTDGDSVVQALDDDEPSHVPGNSVKAPSGF